MKELKYAGEINYNSNLGAFNCTIKELKFIADLINMVIAFF